MTFMLPHLKCAWDIDQAILTEEEKVICIRFGVETNRECQLMDEILYSSAIKLSKYCTIYAVDISEVDDFNQMYELTDPINIMFFYRNKHILIDCGTGNNNKINWAFSNKQEFIDIVETAYRGASKGRGLVVAPKDYSTKYRY